MPSDQSVNNRTIVILDRNEAVSEASGISIDVDSMSKNRAPGIIPLAPITKSVWTCLIESCLEYCRIVWDIYSTSQLVQVIVAGQRSPVQVNSWSPASQHLGQLMTALPQAMIDTDPCSDLEVNELTSSHRLTGTKASLSLAIQNLSEKLKYSPTEGASATSTAGERVLLLTRISDDSEVDDLCRWFTDSVRSHNSDNSAIRNCQFTVVSVQPNTTERAAAGKVLSVSEEVHCTVWWCTAGASLASCMTNVVLQHHHLSSTIITGIPMKEEQNASSSANYDVELLHSSCLGDRSASRDARWSCSDRYESIMLRWCAPRSTAAGASDLPLACVAAAAATPVDINSRPSSCLTNFLLNGRAVMLEEAGWRSRTPVSSPSISAGGTQRNVSHMLAAHGGVIFLHTLAPSADSQFDGLPDPADGYGRRTDDYRVTQFCRQLIANNKLYPPAGENAELTEGTAGGLQTALDQLSRHTRIWPLTYSDTTLTGVAGLETLCDLLLCQHLSDHDLTECRRIIYTLVGMESRHEPLPVALSTSSASRGRTLKREEQYALLWSELECVVRAHSTTSANHRLLLDCVVECRGRPQRPPLSSLPATTGSATSVDSPSSPPPAEKRARVLPPTLCQRSLLSLWTERNTAAAVVADGGAARRAQFCGRAANEAGASFKLYAHMAAVGSGGASVRERGGAKR